MRDYLVRGGIAANRICSVGLGSAHPPGNCRDSMGKEALIACLQPDRRVEITVGAAGE
ncbi:hypothetical protein [Cardiobacterium valvarum]|uniref:hypothetical protein n=1 Tax=Cardiobacterium valvarum TaxID=194702 RepID=UPI00030868AF|nr:hypothetical protein [Cardiobacterium valvarum]